MVEYASVRSSLYDIDSLVTQLNERAGDGWEVVQILPTGGDVTAVLRRSPGSDTSVADMAQAEGAAFAATGAADAPTVDEAPEVSVEEVEAIAVVEDLDTGEVVAVEEVTEVGAAEEPPGWAVAPTVSDAPAAEEAAPEAPATEEAAPEAAEEPSAPEAAPETAADVTEPPPAPAPVTPEAPPAPPAPAPTPQAIPAGWYPDPSGRYELRYWDGNAWTEHVARQGQMYTDPPVA